MERLRGWIFAITLGVILPGILLRVIPSQQEEMPQEAPAAKLHMVQVLMEDGSVSTVELEIYVMGVVAAEMPESFDIEAMKAQAVLARTYALKRMQAGDKHPEGFLCAKSSCCQAYKPDAVTDIVKTAVEETTGMVLTYEDQLIEATYYSCSGGQTEDAAAVWGQDVPYLRSVESPGEEQSAHYVTTTKLSAKEFYDMLGADPVQGFVSDLTYTDGGGIDTVTIGGKNFTGVQLRQLLGLKSTAIRMSVVGDQVIITTKGYGHRVGMSQYGADAMAVAGRDFTEILSHYYPGTVLDTYGS